MARRYERPDAAWELANNLDSPAEKMGQPHKGCRWLTGKGQRQYRNHYRMQPAIPQRTMKR